MFATVEDYCRHSNNGNFLTQFIYNFLTQKSPKSGFDYRFGVPHVSALGYGLLALDSGLLALDSGLSALDSWLFPLGS